jgi:hypothetical protein
MAWRQGLLFETGSWAQNKAAIGIIRAHPLAVFQFAEERRGGPLGQYSVPEIVDQPS